MKYTCEFGLCEQLATVHIGNQPADRHYCDEHAEAGLHKYLAAQREAQQAAKRRTAQAELDALAEQLAINHAKMKKALQQPAQPDRGQG